MRIKKTTETTPRTSEAVNEYSNSTKDAYACDYINKLNTYSTDEVFTGKYWIDGKKIYRRIVNFTTWTLAIDLSSWNIDTLTSMQGTYRQTDGTYNYQRPIGYGAEFINMFYRESDKTIQFRTSYTTTTNIYRVSATLEYTKTND